MNKIIGSFLFFCFTCTLFADEPLAVQGEKVVVTASRFSEKESRLPVKVQVISQKEIQDSSAKNLAELLNQKLPYYVKESPGYTGTVWIRGMKSDDSGAYVSSRVLVLLNGHPAGTGLIDSIPLLSIEKIEVIAGPFSASYGSGALGGVVNIITVKKSEKGLRLHLETGSFEYQNAQFQIGFLPTPDLGFILSAGTEQKGDYEIGHTRFNQKDQYSTSINGSLYRNTGYKNNKAYFGIEYQGNQSLLQGSLQYFGIPRAGAPGSFLSNDPNDSTDFNRVAGDFTFQYVFSKQLDFNSVLYFSGNDRTNTGLDPSPVYQFQQKSTQGGFAPSLKYKSGSLELLGGINGDFINLQKNGNAYSEPDTLYLIVGSFAESRVQFLDYFNLFLGARYDAYSAKMGEGKGIVYSTPPSRKNFDFFSYRSGLSLNYEKLVFKFYAGTGFTAPSAAQLTGSYSGPWGTSGNKNFLGNPNLKPEESFSYQVTTGYNAAHALLLTYGYQKTKNRIAQDSSSDPITYKNIQEAYTRFGELESRLNWGQWLGIKNVYGNLNLKGAYFFQAKDSQTNQELMPYLPETKLCANLAMGLYPVIDFNFSYNFTGRLIDGASYNDIGYTHLLNSSIRIKPVLFFAPESIHNSLQLIFQVKNILEYQYENVDGYPMPGREYIFGVEYLYQF